MTVDLDAIEKAASGFSARGYLRVPEEEVVCIPARPKACILTVGELRAMIAELREYRTGYVCKCGAPKRTVCHRRDCPVCDDYA